MSKIRRGNWEREGYSIVAAAEALEYHQTNNAFDHLADERKDSCHSIEAFNFRRANQKYVWLAG